jgi:hypothetical protein
MAAAALRRINLHMKTFIWIETLYFETSFAQNIRGGGASDFKAAHPPAQISNFGMHNVVQIRPETLSVGSLPTARTSPLPLVACFLLSHSQVDKTFLFALHK